MRLLAMALAALVSSVGIASAQPRPDAARPDAATRPAPSNLAAPPAPAPPPTPRYRENVALGLSLGGTLASWAALATAYAVTPDCGNCSEVRFQQRASQGLWAAGLIGVMVGPGFGHWYAGKYVTRGLVIRLVATGLGVAGLIATFAPGSRDNDGSAIGIPIVFGALYLGGTVDDVVQAPRRARRRNARAVAVVPTWSRDGAGLALAGRW